MIYHDKYKYAIALERWRQSPMKIINGEGFVLVKGDWIPFSEYQRHNPKPCYEPPPVENEDTTQIPRSTVAQHKKS